VSITRFNSYSQFLTHFYVCGNKGKHCSLLNSQSHTGSSQCINAALASIYRNGICLVVCLSALLEKYCVQAAPSNRWHFLTSTSPRTNRCSSLNGTYIPLLIEMTLFPSHSFRYAYSSLFAFATCPERCGSTRGHPCLMVKRLDRGTDHRAPSSSRPRSPDFPKCGSHMTSRAR
jgi:hypothetical protein